MRINFNLVGITFFKDLCKIAIPIKQYYQDKDDETKINLLSDIKY
jgi:hypothetical protein